MAKNSPKPGAGLREESKASRLLPLLLFMLFCAALIYCCWLIWEQGKALHASRASAASRLELLQSQKTELEKLLDLAPCEAKEKLPSTLKSFLPPDTAPASRLEEGAKTSASSPKKQAVASTPEEIEAACVFLVSLAQGNKLSTGSGFFVAPGYIATNRHVLGQNPGKVLVTSKALGHPVAGRVVAQGNAKGEDFALVAVSLPEGTHVQPLKFAPAVKKTQKVGAWGFPNIIGKNDPAYARLLKGEDINAVPELSYSEGVVSAVLDREPRIIVHTAPISPGNSGGPLLDANGDLVGINTMITLDEDSYRQASLALSAEDLAIFLKKHGISLPD